MSIQRTPMTRAGYERLRDEVERLKKERPSIVRAIAEARAHGDLSENAEYHAARERQGFIEARITDLESKVGTAEVIDPPTSGDRVTFGSTVKLEDEDGKEAIYQIVGSDEADPKRGMISIMSPLARTLISKKVGDRVVATLPGGKKTFEILAANFPIESGAVANQVGATGAAAGYRKLLFICGGPEMAPALPQPAYFPARGRSSRSRATAGPGASCAGRPGARG